MAPQVPSGVQVLRTIPALPSGHHVSATRSALVVPHVPRLRSWGQKRSPATGAHREEEAVMAEPRGPMPAELGVRLGSGPWGGPEPPASEPAAF